MIIKDIEGNSIYGDGQKTVRRTVEAAILKGIPLLRANLRGVRLKYAILDGLQADGACFWGADLTGANITGASLSRADLRNTCLENTCFAETDLSGADLRGSFFKQTLLEQSNMEKALLGGESFFSCDLSGIRGLESASYDCENGTKIGFGRSPIIINGLTKRLVLIGGHILWGRELYGPAGKKWQNSKGNREFRVPIYPDNAKKPILKRR